MSSEETKENTEEQARLLITFTAGETGVKMDMHIQLGPNKLLNDGAKAVAEALTVMATACGAKAVS